MLSIENLSIYLPETYKKINVAFQDYGVTQQQAKIFNKIYGIDKIPTSSKSMVAFLQESIEPLLYSVKPEEIKYLIHTHTSRVINPLGYSVIHQLKQKLNLKNAISFGISLTNCASILDALEVVSHLFSHDPDHTKAIIVAGDKTFSQILRSIPRTSIMGEASAALLISKHGLRHKMVALSSQTYGKYSEGVWQADHLDILFENSYTAMLAKNLQTTLDKAGLNWNDIKLILPHNVNLLSWYRTAKTLAITREKIFLSNIKNTAHCFGADIIINLSSALNQKLLRPGDYYLLSTVGLGATFASALFQY